MYILAWMECDEKHEHHQCMSRSDNNTDYWVAHEDLQTALTEHHKIAEKDRTMIAAVTLVLHSTDYTYDIMDDIRHLELDIRERRSDEWDREEELAEEQGIEPDENGNRVPNADDLDWDNALGALEELEERINTALKGDKIPR